MRDQLEAGLGLPASFITYFEGASGREWGNWPKVDFLMRKKQGARRSNWWLTPSVCNGPAEDADTSTHCLLSRFVKCVNPANGTIPRLCNELCYTLHCFGDWWKDMRICNMFKQKSIE